MLCIWKSTNSLQQDPLNKESNKPVHFIFLVNIPWGCSFWPHTNAVSWLYVRTGHTQELLERTFPSSLGHKAKRLSHTMHAAPLDPPPLGRASPVFVWLLEAGHHPNGNKGAALLHCNHHSLSAPRVLIPGWQHRKVFITCASASWDRSSNFHFRWQQSRDVLHSGSSFHPKLLQNAHSPSTLTAPSFSFPLGKKGWDF